MDQCEDREEEVPPSETTRGQRIPERLKLTHDPEPEPSCVSFKSNMSKNIGADFKSPGPSSSERVDQQSSEVPSGPSAQQHQTQLDSIFMLLEENIVTFVKNELKKIQKVLSPDYPECSESQRDDEKLEGEDEKQRRSSREAVMKITLNFLRKMKQGELADHLQSKHRAEICQHQLKSGLKKKFQSVFEGIAKAGSPTLLNQIYTELYITEGGTGEVNDEHEVRQIETASRKPHRPETTIRQEDIFKVPPGGDQPIRTVMTKGVAGIGKTVLTQKFTLDWAEDKAHQNIQLIFPFTFRELNVLREKKFSLVGLIHHFFTETKGICSFEHFQVLFIFDGLDESRLPLDFHNKEILTEATESSSVDVLLTNLIRGKLLPSALLWITTRPAAANQIPPECVGMVTEVRGFNDPQKEEYFRKRFRDEQQASRIISHMKTSRSLHIMCHIPVFCWITATVLEDVLETREGGELPSTLTEMYIHFLVVQTKVKKVKYGGAETDPHWSPESRKMIESLGKLAFDQLQKGNLIFYESDLTECGIDIRAASVYSGVFTQIFREERGLYQDKVFCFVHLSVQEFLAALHVHLTFINSGVKKQRIRNEEEKNIYSSSLPNTPQLKSPHQSTVDQALQSPYQQLGVIPMEEKLTSNMPSFEKIHPSIHPFSYTLVPSGVWRGAGAHPQRGNSGKWECTPWMGRQSIATLKQIPTSNMPSTEETLTILDQPSFQGKLKIRHLHQRAVDQALQSPYQQLGVIPMEEKLTSNMPSIEETLTILDQPSFQGKLKIQHLHQRAVDQALQSPNGHLDLFLRFLLGLSLQTNQRLLQGLVTQTGSSSQTNQETVQYIKMKISHYVSAEKSINLFHCLNELNDRSLVEKIQQSLSSGSLSTDELSPAHWSALGFILVSSGEVLDVFDLKKYSASEEVLLRLLPVVKTSNIALLSGCKLSKRSCEALTSVISSPSCSLTELDLSHNNLRDSGVELLYAGLENPNCNLTTLRLSCSKLSKTSCVALSSVLRSPSCCLRDLDLSDNDLQDSGANILFVGLNHPNCKLMTLRLSDCKLSEKSCGALFSLLSSPSCSLTELDLSHNNLRDSGVELLYAGLKSPNCNLTTLRLSYCNLSERSCEALTSVLSSQSYSLTELDLSNNNLRDSAVELLYAGLKSPNCKLTTLRVEPAGVQSLVLGSVNFCQLAIDTITATRNLKVSEDGRKVTCVEKLRLNPDHPDRFDHPNVLCRTGLTGRCYWEVEWSGCVDVSVSYRRISRGDWRYFAYDLNQCWTLRCSDHQGFSVWHNDDQCISSSSVSNRVSVYVDYPAGILSFYRVSDSLILLHTFKVKFIVPLYPGFSLHLPGSSVFLC